MSIKRIKYNRFIYEDLIINFARSRCRTIHITIKPDGEVYYVVPYGTSEKDIYKFLDEKKTWIIKNVDKMKSRMVDDIVTKEEEKILKEKISNYIKKYEVLTGLKVNRFTLRNMKTLWGSCSYKKNTIRFNKKLIKKPDGFIEYIVLHEMCHIVVPNHSKSFYSMVEKYMSDYKEKRKLGK